MTSDRSGLGEGPFTIQEVAEIFETTVHVIREMYRAGRIKSFGKIKPSKYRQAQTAFTREEVLRFARERYGMKP